MRINVRRFKIESSAKPEIYKAKTRITSGFGFWVFG